MVSRAEFEQIFPGHIGFYSYDGFAAATSFGSAVRPRRSWPTSTTRPAG